MVNYDQKIARYYNRTGGIRKEYRHTKWHSDYKDNVLIAQSLTKVAGLAIWALGSVLIGRGNPYKLP